LKVAVFLSATKTGDPRLTADQHHDFHSTREVRKKARRLGENDAFEGSRRDRASLAGMQKPEALGPRLQQKNPRRWATGFTESHRSVLPNTAESRRMQEFFLR
jgi:hypothetical protein